MAKCNQSTGLPFEGLKEQQ